MFVRYLLRTTAPAEARAFYTRIGVAFDDVVDLTELPPPARARGAPPHWLAHIGVPDVDAARADLLARGCEALGPDALRDPWGAVFALAPARAIRSPVAWHQLHTTDLDAAWALYAPLLGCVETGTVDAANTPGGHRMFEGGSMANTARWPGVHAQWLLFFRVADLDRAIAATRDGGGETVADVVTIPNGMRIVPCHDPHRGAFGLAQAAP